MLITMKELTGLPNLTYKLELLLKKLNLLKKILS